MQFIEQSLQKSHVPHSFMMSLTFSDFRPFIRLSCLSICIRVKKGQGKAIEASGFKETVVDAYEHLIRLLKPPKDWNLK